MLQTIKEFVDKLQSTTGRLDKESYLKEYVGNEVVRTFVHFLLNPYIVTGISKKKVSKFRNIPLTETDFKLTVLDLFKYLEENNTGKDENILIVEDFIRDHEEYRDLITGIVTKDIKLGIQSTTVNKIWGKGFIPTFDVMLGTKYFDNPDKYVPNGTDFILTTKLDGVRCVCINDYTGVKFFSRQGQPILDLVEIEEEVKNNLPKGYVYDGELLLKNDNNLHSKDLYRATVKITGSDNIKINLTFNVFDIISTEDFQDGFSPVPAADRKYLLHQYLSKRELSFVKEVAILYKGTDKGMIAYYLNKITNAGGEGVMINISDAPYECKRSQKLLKVKEMQTADVLVVDVEEGSGQNAGVLGSIRVKFIGPDNKEYECNCGSGFKMDERDLFWKNPNLILDKIVEVQYFEISQNENGDYSLRFPVFKYIRGDKNEISMN